MIRIFIVFAITGSSSVFVGRPIMKLIGITKENLNPFIYWVLFIIIGLIFYQILLVFFGWLFGQGKFFWEFEKKMLKRFGFGKFIN
ncbi:MAG: diacylglyceryl transferase [Psychroserpens sp.]|nr:diacylglyceryl transferase [Psychroserpens sp.]